MVAQQGDQTLRQLILRHMLSCARQSKISFLGFDVVNMKTRRQLKEQYTNKTGQLEREFGFSEIDTLCQLKHVIPTQENVDSKENFLAFWAKIFIKGSSHTDSSLCYITLAGA